MAGVALCAGIGSYVVLTSTSPAVLPFLYVFLPGIATGMFTESRRVSPVASALTNAVFFAGLVVCCGRFG